MKTANDYKGLCDSDILEAAVADRQSGIVIIPERRQDDEPERTYWLIDKAIVLPENTTVILQNCKIKLSDKCRDNFFRSANCGVGIEDIKRIRNIHIKGEGCCILEGADHPRATGDESKLLKCPCPKTREDVAKYGDWIPEEKRAPEKLGFWDLHCCSYGTDCGKVGENQHGDFRGIGILFANVEDFSIENIKIVESHGWGISLEECASGRIEHIEFDSRMAKMIDGMLSNTENQDGIDLRNGCHDILINDITGGTGDDVVALTAIAHKEKLHPSGDITSTHVMHNDWSRRDTDIHDIIIRNIRGYSKGGICYHVRLLPAESKIWNVVIDGVVDTSPVGVMGDAVILLGAMDGDYGRNLPGSIKNISISNVICNSKHAIRVQGYLSDSVISNLINKNPDCPAIRVDRKGGMENVKLSNIVTPGEEVKYK